MSKALKGMILAAGLGTRLRPLTYFRSKAAVPLLNRPLITYSLELLSDVGIEEVVINLHHLPESVRSAVYGREEVVHYSIEDQILGTAGGIGKVRELLSGNTFVVSNGKIYFEDSLQEALAFHQTSRALATLVLVPFSDRDPFNPVLVDSENNVVAFARSKSALSHPPRFETMTTGTQSSPYVFTGIHILEPAILEFIPDGPCDIVMDVYEPLIARGYSIRGFVSQGYWCESSTAARYLTNSLALLGRKNLDCLATDISTQNCSRSVLGEQARVHPSSSIDHSILWNEVVVEADCRLENVILADGVRLPRGTHLKNAIVTPSCPNPGFELTATARTKTGNVIWPLTSDQ